MGASQTYEIRSSAMKVLIRTQWRFSVWAQTAALLEIALIFLASSRNVICYISHNFYGILISIIIIGNPHLI